MPSPKYDAKSLAGTRVLITGGAGMIGSTLAHIAVLHGARVTVLDALLPLYGGNMFNLSGILDKIVFIKRDIREGNLVEFVKDVDIVFHLAAQVSYVDSNQDPFLDLDINCRGLLNLLTACKVGNPSAKLVFSSSRFVYGSIEHNPVDENHPLNCLSIYGIHKLTGERYLRFYHEAYGMDTTSVRIANPYGPRQQMRHSKYGIVNWFVRLALEGKPLTVYGEGNQKRDYIYVDDVAEALLAVALTPGTSGEVYNVGSGIGTRFVDMAHCIARQIPETRVINLPWPSDRYFVETGDYVTDIAKIQSVTGWTPKVTLEHGIESTIEYYRAYRQYYW